MEYLLEFKVANLNEYWIKLLMFTGITCVLIYILHLILTNSFIKKIKDDFYDDLGLLFDYSRLYSSLLALSILSCFWGLTLYLNGTSLFDFTSFKLSMKNTYFLISPYLASLLICVFVFKNAKNSITSKF
ncbi:MAG: hypothetical protein CMP66_04185 [Flavobacteriales bacterium]|nr:hypothetical protein [Flavobacteriales bacterium]|tara:strand:+ start:331 stop:720 length:390 start_codon:yes stop_codon:yes gene_type:complete